MDQAVADRRDEAGRDRGRSARISLVVNTLNEEARLEWALRSARPWVDEMIVVDMHSDDRTREIAEAHGARVYLHERLGYADPARAFAIEKATGSWIMILDADEMVPRSLGERLRLIADEDDTDVVAIPFRNFLFGSELHHAGWGRTQDYHPRFFRRSAVSASGAIHDFLSVDPSARVVRLPATDDCSIVHFNYLDVAEFMDKLNRYTTIEARGRARSKGGRAFALLAATHEFISRFVIRQGFRDGWRGFYLSLLMATYKIVVGAKVRETAEGRGADAAESTYASIAANLLRPDDASG